MKNAVVFGAGAIGLAFLGDLLDRSGYATTFLDVRDDIVAALSQRGGYDIRIVSRDQEHLRHIRNVRAINTATFAVNPSVREAVCRSLAEADFIATAAGERALTAIAPILAAGLARRLEILRPGPISVMCCENIADPAAILRAGIERALPPATWGVLAERLGIARSVISRMTPVITSLDHIVTEAYDEIPVEAAAWRGPAPDIVGLRLVDNFTAYKVRKLIMHNMTHATAAYLGYFLGKRDIGEAMQDARIAAVTRAAMREAMDALLAEFDLPRAEQEAHAEDLLHRYGNPALGHTVANVARDPIRKLGPDDRLMTAVRLAERHQLPHEVVLFSISLALNYDHPTDAEAQMLQRRLVAEGVKPVIQSVCGVQPDEPLCAAVADAYTTTRAAIVAARAAGDTGPICALVDDLLRRKAAGGWQAGQAGRGYP